MRAFVGTPGHLAISILAAGSLLAAALLLASPASAGQAKPYTSSTAPAVVSLTDADLDGPAAPAPCDDWTAGFWRAGGDCAADPLITTDGEAASATDSIAGHLNFGPIPPDAEAVRRVAIGWGLISLDVMDDDEFAERFGVTLPLLMDDPMVRRSLPHGTVTRPLPNDLPSGMSMRGIPAMAISGVITATAAMSAVWLGGRLPVFTLLAMNWCTRRLDARILGVRRIVTVDEIDPNAALTPAAVLRRGWSPEIIDRLLGRPDYAVVDPLGLREPLILVSRPRLEMMERSAEFREFHRMRMMRAKHAESQISKWVALRETPGIWSSAA